MTGLFLTRNATPILSQFAAILGWLIERIFDLLYSMGTPSVGLAIILFTIVVYTLMIPLTYKQQKFARMSVRMNPEIQAIQKKYQGKQDQVSMVKMQDEMKAVYAKYGTSQTGSCLPLLPAASHGIWTSPRRRWNAIRRGILCWSCPPR